MSNTMQYESNKSGHWTDDQLIARVYGAETTSGEVSFLAAAVAGETAFELQHLEDCQSCRKRLEAMYSLHSGFVADANDWSDVSPAFLVDQRRKIYSKLAEKESWWPVKSVWRWASAGTAVAALGAGLIIFTDGHHSAVHSESNVSDAQLAQEVSSLSLDAEARSAAPLEALFE